MIILGKYKKVFIQLCPLLQLHLHFHEHFVYVCLDLFDQDILCRKYHRKTLCPDER